MSGYFYQVGGSLVFNHPTYVERKADQELLNLVRQRQFCYVFNSRQMGKSSLRVRTIHQLQQEGKICLSVDLTSLGSDVTKEQWYAGLLNQLFSGLKLSGQVNLKQWLKERQELPAVQKLGQFIENILLKNNTNTEYFIFIDEIDKVLSLNFSLDDFFSWIRYCYNQRAEEPEYQRITFILFGVATPIDLIQSKVETPFNIGKAIELTGFNEEEINPLADGLREKSSHPEIVLKEILYWTAGQPFLTQKICQLISQTKEEIQPRKEKEYVEELIENQIIRNWESQDEPVHLRIIRDRLLYYPDRSSSLLGLYQNILTQGSTGADNSQQESELRLSGLVVKQENQLRVYNRIYQAVFDLKWLEQEFQKLRPYSESILIWQSSQFQDTSRLLRGKALEDAEIWSKGKNLSSLDYQFLADSRKLATQEVEVELSSKQKAISILERANVRAKQILFGSIGASVFLLMFSFFIYKKQQEAVEGNQLQLGAERAWKEFSYSQIQGLNSATNNAKKLYEIVKDGRPLQDYPAISPIIVLNKILTRLRELHQINGYQDKVNSLSYSPDGSLLATASSDGTLKIVNLKTKSIKNIVNNNEKDPIYSVSISPKDNRIAAAYRDGMARIWTIDGQLIATLKGHKASINEINFNAKGDLIVTASRDKTARIWNRDGQIISILKGHTKSVSSAVFAPKAQEIATVSADGTVKRWTLQGQQKTTLSLGVPINDVNYSLDGKWLAVALNDGTYILLNLQTKQAIKKYAADQSALNSIKYSPDGRYLATGSRDGIVRVWTVEGKLLQTFKGHQDSVNDARFAPDLHYLATASNDTHVKIWSLSQSAPLLQSDETVTSSSYNHQKKSTAFSTNIGNIYILNNEGKVLKKWPANRPDWIYSIDLSGDGRYLVTGSISGVVKVFDNSPNGKLLLTLDNFAQKAYAVKFSPNAQLLAVAYQPRVRGDKIQVDIYHFLGNKLSKMKSFVVDTKSNPIYSLSFDSKSQQIAIASQNELKGEGVGTVWDLQGNLKYTIQTAKKLLYQMQFSPQDDDILITASRDGEVKLWRDNGRQSVNVNLPEDFLPVYRVAFSSDGQSIATGSEDGSVRLWKKDGTLVAEFVDTPEAIYGLSFLNSNQDLLTLTRNGNLKVWHIGNAGELKNLLNEACQKMQDYLLGGPQFTGCSTNN